MDYLVSEPARLLLVRESYPGILETTLVVPQLPVARLPYSRFLVDAGATFEEHAVGRVDRRLTEAEIGFVRVALSAARPTVVSVLQPDEGALGVDPGNRSSAWAAAAVDAAQEIDGMSSGNAVGVTLSDGRSERRFSVARQGKFFAVREVK